MKRKHASSMMASVTACLLSMFVLSNTFAASAQKSDVNKKVTTTATHKKILTTESKTNSSKGGGAAKGIDDPDLHAHYVSADFMDGGNVQINGRIENEGGGDFVSDPSQAEARIVLHLTDLEGPAAYPMMKRVPISRLNSGDTLNISETFDIREYAPGFVRWGTSPAGTVCNASLDNVEFIVQYTYDPDIHDDGNPQNDDDDPSNDLDRHVTNESYVAACPR